MGHLQNRLLAALPADVLVALKGHLKSVGLTAGQVLSETGDEVQQVYFPQTCVVSLVVGLKAGDVIETAMAGHDSVLNASAALDGRISINRGIVQLAGSTSVVDVGPLREIAREHERFRSVLLHHEQVLFAYAQQSVACNARHSIEARACRWLLRLHDLAEGEDIGLTQEQLAQMLGVRRPGVSIVAENLKRGGLISYHRGLIRLSDIERLRRTSCECYGIVKALYENMLKVKFLWAFLAAGALLRIGPIDILSL